MCDTLVALGNATSDGSVILAKNSDREPNEAHELLIIPAVRHNPGSMVKCTYIEIPQVSETHAVLLAKPFWIWGAEMGVNEYGVAIGNEAVFTKVPYEKQPGLIGMDFLRLALERAKSAREALDVIVSLLETHGQGGNCGFLHPLYYHNSFIIADPSSAWVLETAGRQWAAQRVKDVRSISNAITIGSEWDLASDGLIRHAVERGWCKGKDDFHFARCYSDFLYTRFSASKERFTCTSDILRSNLGKIDVRMMMDTLRFHGNDGGNLRLDQSLVGADVCMHAGFGPVRGSQSVGSLVAHLSPAQQTCWVTGTSAPCTSVFKPVWIDSGLPVTPDNRPTGTYDERTLFWRHEMLHREVLREYSARMSAFSTARDGLEDEFIQQSAQVINSSPAARLEFSEKCFRTADTAEESWLTSVKSVPVTHRLRFYYSNAWNQFNHQAKIPIEPI